MPLVDEEDDEVLDVPDEDVEPDVVPLDELVPVPLVPVPVLVVDDEVVPDVAPPEELEELVVDGKLQVFVAGSR